MNAPRTNLLQLAAAALLAAADLSAQSAQAISLQVSGLYNAVREQDSFDGLNAGWGGEAQIRYTPGALSLGAGFQYTAHDLDVFMEDAELYGGFFEPRYRIHTGSYTLAPYVSARFSLLKMGFTGDDLSVSSSFIQLNAGGGLLYRIGPRFNLDVGATFGYNRLSEGTFRSERFGVLDTFDAETGTNLVLRLGLAVGLGG